MAFFSRMFFHPPTVCRSYEPRLRDHEQAQKRPKDPDGKRHRSDVTSIDIGADIESNTHR